MGGWGSDRWYRYGTKPLAEHCLRLDINKLKREDLSRPGLRYSSQWESGSNIGIETFPDKIELSYTVTSGEEGEEHIRYRVPRIARPVTSGLALLVYLPREEVRQKGEQIVWA